jgi:hypothetical protein
MFHDFAFREPNERTAVFEDTCGNLTHPSNSIKPDGTFGGSSTSDGTIPLDMFKCPANWFAGSRKTEAISPGNFKEHEGSNPRHV